MSATGPALRLKEGRPPERSEGRCHSGLARYLLPVPLHPGGSCARGYLVNEKPDAILNIIDGTNIERNLYLTTQLIELGIPVVMAVNMIDLVRKNGDKIDLKKLSAELGCQAVEISALKGEGSMKAAEMAVAAAKSGKAGELPHVFTGSVEHAIAHIEESIQARLNDRFLRWLRRQAVRA